jgi:hypothetical protein
MENRMPPELKFVLGAGAGGGLVSWAFTIMTGATFGLGPWLALPMCVILGTAAALIAVYVITPTDTSKTGRLIGYAVLCGFLWKPVLDAGRVLISQRIEAAQTAASVKKSVDELKTATPQTSTAAVGEKAHDVADQAAELLRSSDRLDNPRLEKQATERATAAVDAIALTSTADPEAAKLALTEIRKAAEDSNNGELAQFTATRIQRLDVQMLPATTTEPTTTTPP